MTTRLLGRLRRVTNHRPWVPEIDGLRFFAIAGVLFYHMSGELQVRSGRIIPIEHRYRLMNLWLGNGDRGVRLFFVISGLVLALPFARHYLTQGKAVPLRKYFLRRLTRLEPPYIAAAALFTLAVLVYQHSLGRAYFFPALASLFYVHNILYTTFPPNMVLWSLEVEVQFYLLAPLFMQVFRIPGKARRRGVLLAVMLLCGLLQAPFLDRPHVAFSLLKYVQYFLAGLVLADVFVLDLPTLRESWWWDMLGVGIGIYGLSMPYNSISAHIALPFLFALLCLASMRSFALRRIVSNPWVAIVGGMCYSIYMLHMMTIAAIFKVSRRLIIPHVDFLGNYIVQVLLCFPLLLAASAVFYLAVERPCMDPDWPRKLVARLQSLRSGAVVAATQPTRPAREG